MKYIIIGIILLYIAFPAMMAMETSYSIEDFLSEWWDAFKTFFPLSVGVIAIFISVIFIIYGMIHLGRG